MYVKPRAVHSRKERWSQLGTNKLYALITKKLRSRFLQKRLGRGHLRKLMNGINLVNLLFYIKVQLNVWDGG